MQVSCRVSENWISLGHSERAPLPVIAALIGMRKSSEGPSRYVALHKPYMTLCSIDHDDSDKSRQTLADLGLPDGLFNVGRLDRDSEGLLLLTNNGQFCHLVLQGDEHLHKRYFVLVDGQPSNETIASMAAGGLQIRGRITKESRVRKLDWQQAEAALSASGAPRQQPQIRSCTAADSTWLEVHLQEGMNRQVRRMTEAVRHRTLRLVRMGIGQLRAEQLALAPGEWTHIVPSDVLPSCDLHALLPLAPGCS